MGAARTALVSSVAALGQRDFRWYVTGQLVSMSGTWMQRLAVIWLAVQLSESAVFLGVIAALQQLPTLLLAPLAGRLADRIERRVILMWSTGASMILTAALLAINGVGGVTAVLLCGVAVLQGLFEALDKPARMSIVNDLVEDRYFTNAVSLNSIVMDSGRLVGPATAGIVIQLWGVQPALAVNLASYVPMAIALVVIRTSGSRAAGRGPTTRQGMGAALRYAWRTPAIMVALVLMLIAGLFAYNWNVLLPTIVLEAFGGGAGEVGFAFAAMSLGGVIGGLALAGSIRATNRAQLIAATSFGLLFLAVAIAPGYAWLYVVLFLVGAASVAFRAITTALVQVRVDPQMRGRMIALYILAFSGTTPIGAPMQGWIAEMWGARWSWVIAAATVLAAAGAAIVWFRFRGTRAADQPLQ